MGSRGNRPKHMSLVSNELLDIANKLRIDCILSTNVTKSGHPASCSSIAEIMAVLFFSVMRYDVHDPRNPASDSLILSKAHAAPILYASWCKAGLFPCSKLMSLHALYSDFEGCPTPRLKFVDVATGSVGQGLSLAAGMAYVGKVFDKADYRVYCLLGDSESMEGSVWEAIQFVSYYKLDNLCIIVDVNRLGQSGPTILGHDTEAYRKRYEAFGLHAMVVDGHNPCELMTAFSIAIQTKDKPSIVIARTIKGKNFPGMEDDEYWHGKTTGDKTEKILEYLQSLISNKADIMLKSHPPTYTLESVAIGSIRLSNPPNYDLNVAVATSEAYGTSLVKLAQNCFNVIGFDGDTRNSTFSQQLKDYDSSRFVDCFSGEQNLVGVAIGAACRNRIVAFVSTYGTHLVKAFDHIRLGAISKSNVNFCGSYCGLSVGPGGPGLMALEDIAMFRLIPSCTIFYPTDAIACERAVELAANTKGITYIRTISVATPLLYPNDKTFHIGEAHVLKRHNEDVVLIISAGITLFEALKAEEALAKENIHVRIMDLFTIKPLDTESIIKNAGESRNRIITVEDHYQQGGIGEAILSVVSQDPKISVKIVAVPKIPRSGESGELLDYFGLSCCNIVLHVREMLKG